MAIDHSQSAIPKPGARKRPKNHSRKKKTVSRRKMVIALDKIARKEIVEDRDQNVCQRLRCKHVWSPIERDGFSGRWLDKCLLCRLLKCPRCGELCESIISDADGNRTQCIACVSNNLDRILVDIEAGKYDGL